MKYDTDDPRLTAYLLDELDAAERAEFESDLRQSLELQELLRQTRATLDVLKSELRGVAGPTLSDRQRQVIQCEITSTPGSVRLRSVTSTASTTACKHLRFWWISGIGVATAASLMLAALLLPAVQSSRQAATRAQASARDAYRLGGALMQEETTAVPMPDDFPSAYPDKPVGNAPAESLDQTQADFDTLTDLITSTLAPDTWDDVGGPGAMAEFPGDLSLVIENTQEVHDSVTSPLADDSTDPAAYHGWGPGRAGDDYDVIVENDFLRVHEAPLSTFSIDVDTASYAKVRMFLNEYHQLPRPDAVRIEELINYFSYNYAPPTGKHPFAVHHDVTACPWQPAHQLVRIGIKGKEIPQDRRPASNLVFLLDVSGSMDEPNKLPLVKRGMKMLVDQLAENDRVAIVVYAGAAGRVLDSTLGDQKKTIIEALDRLHAGGSTNGGAGIQLAYQTALDHFIRGGVNRLILCTDGDFNVGATGTDQLVRLVERQAKNGVFLSVLGFGMGNHNDAMLEQISNKGNGNYAFVDTDYEAHKVLVAQVSATLVTIAKDVKIQVEFNPREVAAYRLIGYENRILAAQDFNDDTKDAGEIGAGHSVTALYEIVPAGDGLDVTIPPVDDLKYQTSAQPSEAASNGELLTLKLRYKAPDGDESNLLMAPLRSSHRAFHSVDRDFQFATAVASFGMLLRESKHKGNATYASVLEIASDAANDDGSGYRRGFLELVRTAARLAGELTTESL